MNVPERRLTVFEIVSEIMCGLRFRDRLESEEIRRRAKLMLVIQRG